MKLSEAIREGCKYNKPSEKGWEDRDPATGEVRTCAIMAAGVAEGYVDSGTGAMTDKARSRVHLAYDARTGNLSETMLAPDEWVPVMEHYASTPCECKRHTRVTNGIWHLHDVHKMSREAVSEWVGTLEAKLDAEASAKAKVQAPPPQQTPGSPRVDLGERAALGSPKHEPAVV